MGQSSTVFGIIIGETDDFINFKTRKGEYIVSKKKILTLEPTDRVFDEKGV